MKHSARFRSLTDNGPNLYCQEVHLPAARKERLLHFAQEHGAALSFVQSSLLRLDGSRIFNLLEEYRLLYGRRAREQAATTLHHWRDGQTVIGNEETDHLLTLLGHQLTAAEKIAFFQGLRQEWIASLPRNKVRVTALRGDDMLSIARRVAGSVYRVQASAISGDMLALLGWSTDADAHALARIAFDGENYLAVHRLAAVMVQLATLGRLCTLASPQVTVRVRAHLEVPTLAVDLNFLPCFLMDIFARQGDPSGQSLLVRLQDMALAQTSPTSTQDFTSQDFTRQDFSLHVRERLSPQEYAHLGMLAVGHGIQVEHLLKEIEVQTLSARSDIEATIAVAERIKAGLLSGRVVSEHAGPCFRARIEIKNGICPVASVTSLANRVSRWALGSSFQ